MDFFERLVGIAPDQGSGWLEVILLSVPFALAAAWRIRGRNAKPRAHRG
jgi:hypothetical protein